MVTRRPLEMLLVNDDTEDYCLVNGVKETDFKSVERTLKKLNLQVSEDECISHIPIQLEIHSRNVPDLMLVDLPGYIQVTTKYQPKKLEQRIRDLCETYLEKDNIVLAVSAADVDLANSEAIKASRKHDPHGNRTIGVITKLDLVDKNLRESLLTNEEYPLNLGYVGLGKGVQESTCIGIGTLKTKLESSLRSAILKSLSSVYAETCADLEEARYQFKVQFNDRAISVDSYEANVLNKLLLKFESIANECDRSNIKNELQSLLETRALDIFSIYFWQQRRDLDSAIVEFTTLGLGRLTTNHICNLIYSKLCEISDTKPFKYHKLSTEKLMRSSLEKLKNKGSKVIDSIETCVKPFKYQTEFTPSEWAMGSARFTDIVNKEIEKLDKSLKNIEAIVGVKRLKAAVRALAQGETINEFLHESAQTAVNLNHQIHFLKKRLKSLQEAKGPYSLLHRSREESWLKFLHDVPEGEYAYDEKMVIEKDPILLEFPEVYMIILMDKLVDLSSKLIWHELSNEFFSGRIQFDCKVEDDPVHTKHLSLQHKREKLESVREKLKHVLDQSY